MNKNVNLVNIEPLFPAEIQFLLLKRTSENQMYYKTLVGMAGILGAILTFLTIFAYNYHNVKEGTFPLANYLIVSFFTYFFIFQIAFWVKYNGGRNYKKDIAFGKKLIYSAKIIRKQGLEHMNQYYFTIDFQDYQTVTVTKEDYQFYQIDDELNVEFTKYTETFLGYY